MEKNKAYKVILADDHVLLRDALASLVNSFDECQVAGVASNGRELKGIIENGILPDIVILDLNMPVMDGYETAQWLQEKHPGIRILILTMYDSEIALIRLLQQGVRGFLKKTYIPVNCVMHYYLWPKTAIIIRTTLPVSLPVCSIRTTAIIHLLKSLCLRTQI